MTQHPKTALVTGGTGGIGLETARGLAEAGWRVVITGRNPKAAEAASTERRHSWAADVLTFTADLSNQAEVQGLIREINVAVPRIDALVLNAGALDGERFTTADGVANMVAVNHVAPWMMAHGLRPNLAVAAPSRVVIVSSSAHRFAQFDGVSLEPRTSFVGLGSYGDSKLLNLLTFLGWSEELAKDGIHVLAADPGGASTGMTQAMQADFLPWFMRPMWPLMNWMFNRKEPAETRRIAAVSSIAAASNPIYDGRTAVFGGAKGQRSRAIKSGPFHSEPVRGLGSDTPNLPTRSAFEELITCSQRRK